MTWLGRRFWNRTFTQEEDVDVNKVRKLLDEDKFTPLEDPHY
jgi:hypothetical protein